MATFDFGFTAVTEDELHKVQQSLAAVQQATTTAKSAQEKAQAIYDMVIPLLDNLAKDPEKDYIYWPKRQAKIREFKATLQNILK
jgi:type II secretory pathway pseudopilin PulG